MDVETGELPAEVAAEFPLPVLNRMDTMRGDLRDAMLQRLRAMPKPFTVMSEAEQREMIEGVDRVATHLVSEACKIIAANGHAAFRAVPDGFKNKGDDVTIQLKAVGTDLAHALLEHKGAPVMIVLASPEAYMGETAPAKPDPDEPPLPLETHDKDTGEVVSIRRGRGRPPGSGKKAAGPPVAGQITHVPPPPVIAQPVKASSLEELLTLRHPRGATMAMIINAGFHAVEVSDLMNQGKIAQVDEYYIWEDAKIEPENPEDDIPGTELVGE